MFKIIAIVVAGVLPLTACIPPESETCQCNHGRGHCSGPLEIGGVAPSDYPGC